MKTKINYIVYNSLDQVDLEKWKMFYKTHKNCSIFQSFEMYSFWKNQVNHEPFICLIENDKEECLGFCTGVVVSNNIGIVKKLSSRGIIYGDPLIKDIETYKEVLNIIILNIEKEIKNKVSYIEFRNFFNDFRLNKIFKLNKWSYIPYQNYILELNSEDEVFKRFHREKRRQIRKSLREGVEFSYDKSRSNIEDVYKILFKIYKERAKKPIPDLDFFINLLNMNQAQIISVNYKNKVIGGGFFLFDKNTIYNWYRGGLDFEYKKQRPSTIADWAIIKYGIENNIKNFDFMGAGIKGKEYGVRTYKSRFGGKLVEFGRFIKVTNIFYYKIGLLGLKVAGVIMPIIELKGLKTIK